MKRYIRGTSDVDVIGYEYGYYNNTSQDREYFTKKYENQGYHNIKVKRIATDTPGVKMYEISGEK